MYICKYLTHNIKTTKIVKFSKQCEQTRSSTLIYVLIIWTITVFVCKQGQTWPRESERLSTDPQQTARGFATVQNTRMSKVIFCSCETWVLVNVLFCPIIWEYASLIDHVQVSYHKLTNCHLRNQAALTKDVLSPGTLRVARINYHPALWWCFTNTVT